MLSGISFSLTLLHGEVRYHHCVVPLELLGFRALLEDFEAEWRILYEHTHTYTQVQAHVCMYTSLQGQ